MTKLLLFVSVASVILLIVSYFFGIKPNGKKATRVFGVSMVLGFGCIFGAFVSNHFFENSVVNVFYELLLLFIGFFTVIFSIFFASLSGVASGKSFNGQYQRMSPEQQKTFWNKVRAGIKAATSWYSRRERRRGNHDRANAAKWTSKML